MSTTLDIRRPSPHVGKALGKQAASRYFVTAERLDAARAQALGFVHERVSPDALDAKVGESRPLDAALRDETARRIADIRASGEGCEGVQAFLQKREPAWRTP